MIKLFYYYLQTIEFLGDIQETTEQKTMDISFVTDHWLYAKTVEFHP